jgi:pilus assembly protein Flp/PilA
MLMLAQGNHVAVVQHQQSSGEVVMSLKSVVQHLKSEIVFYYNLAKDTEGASGIEYAIIAGMAAVALAAFMTPISGSITSIFTSIKAVLPAPAP